MLVVIAIVIVIIIIVVVVVVRAAAVGKLRQCDRLLTSLLSLGARYRVLLSISSSR
jgi:hypothetical protein